MTIHYPYPSDSQKETNNLLYCKNKVLMSQKKQVIYYLTIVAWPPRCAEDRPKGRNATETEWNNLEGTASTELALNCSFSRGHKLEWSSYNFMQFSCGNALKHRIICATCIIANRKCIKTANYLRFF